MEIFRSWKDENDKINLKQNVEEEATNASFRNDGHQDFVKWKLPWRRPEEAKRTDEQHSITEYWWMSLETGWEEYKFRTMQVLSRSISRREWWKKTLESILAKLIPVDNWVRVNNDQVEARRINLYEHLKISKRYKFRLTISWMRLVKAYRV